MATPKTAKRDIEKVLAGRTRNPIAFDFPADLLTGLAREARRQRRPRGELLQEAVRRYLEDREDYRDAVAIKRRGEKTYSLDEVKRHLGL